MSADAIKLLQGRYCNSLTQYSRFVTREVAIGDVPMGGSNPIRIQSMTTTDTMDTLGTVEQTIRMVDAGCEYVRITAPSIKEAQNLASAIIPYRWWPIYILPLTLPKLPRV
jgi:(E)-4-hydroxy-3-methylbut-2-enyl-diphosphate synthase